MEHQITCINCPVGCRMRFTLPQILNHAVFRYCMDKRIAPFSVFYMALAIYFKRLGGTDRFTIGQSQMQLLLLLYRLLCNLRLQLPKQPVYLLQLPLQYYPDHLRRMP